MRPQISPSLYNGRRNLFAALRSITGQSWEKDGYVPYWRGIYDDEGRLMVAINFNMDLGDAGEHADNPEYPVPMTTLAYHFATTH